MGVQGGESFNYNVQLKDSSGAFLSGYSFTYQNPDKAVKTFLSARVDKTQKTLLIKEQAIIYNHGFESKAVICLVEALLTYDKEQGVLTGPLITHTANNGHACSSGTISFINKEQINALFSNTPPEKEKAIVQSKTETLRPDPTEKLHAYFEQKQKTETVTPSIAQIESKNTAPKTKFAPPPAKITEGKDGVYTWKSNKIIFTIWDGSDEDGDRVSVLYNGKEVLGNYTIKNKKKELTLDIGGNELNIITIIALNEGSKSPNTANISIQDGDKIYPIIAYNTIGKKAVLRIKKQ
jgi:hypothetical protein